MDPFSSVLLTANLLALVDNLYRGIKFVRKAAQDPKVDGLFVCLITEKARYAEWKRRMGVETSDDFKTLIPQLPEDARESLPIILAPIEKYIKLAQELFIKYGVSPPDKVDSNRTLRDKVRRLDLLMDGYRQLNDILKTLKNCNDGLLTIAPPAPGYYVSLAGNDQVLETSDQNLDSLRRPQQLQNRLQPVSQPGSDAPDELLEQSTYISNPPSSGQGRSRKVFHPVIELLYSTCLEVLRSITDRYPNHTMEFQHIGDRLQIWGTGLFTERVSVDQALNQPSAAVKFLRNNIAGSLADIAVVLRRALSFLGESDNSPSTLRLREIFSISEISLLPLGDPALDIDEELREGPAAVKFCYDEIADLIECLFGTPSTTEMVMMEAIACLKENPATEERDLVLSKSGSDISLSNIQLAPAKDLLKIDLQLIAAMQESLEDSKFAKYMEHKNRKFDAVKLYKDLGEEARQMRYWANQLANTSGNQTMTSETQTAMMLNLTNIARTFEAGYKSDRIGNNISRDLKLVLDQCLKNFPELEETILAPLSDADAPDPLDILKSSNVELKKLAGSKAPEKRYTKNFALSEKAKLAAADSSSEIEVIFQ